MQMEDIAQRLAAVYSRVSLECKAYLQNDPLLVRQDTCRGIIAQLEPIRAFLHQVSVMKVEDRAKNYNIVYNAISYIGTIAQNLRKSSFGFQIIVVLIEAIKAMQSNLILQDVKYLDKRTELYLRVCSIYEQGEFYQQAVSLLQTALKSYKELRAIHELDKPVPSHVEALLDNNIKMLKIFSIKYSIQAGSLSASDWRKRVDQQFGDDLRAKLSCLVETLKSQTSKYANVFSKNTRTYKEGLLNGGFELVKGPMQILAKGLQQQREKIEREVGFRNTGTSNQQQINQQIKKRREAEEKYIKESQLKKASQSFPLQFHSQMIYYALQINNRKMLGELIQAAVIRIECRRIEVPYVNDISIVVSNSPFPNVPNGYTKIPIDLNQANLRKELAKLRKSGKKPPEDQTLKKVDDKKVDDKKVDKKDSKKGGKEPEKTEAVVNANNSQPTQWQLSEIKHKYVFMMVKKSMSPEEAIYDLRVVLGSEQQGPVGYADNRRIVVPYIQENMKVIESQISQHTGVREITGMLPYLVLFHSRDGLQNQNEKRTLITDVQPLIGKNPMVPARWGYQKIDVDLRQVPEQFIKAPNHDYVYLTYRTDQLFHVNQRQIQVIKAYMQLQQTLGQRKGQSREQDKLLQLQISYSLEKLSLFFQTLQECLRGSLGQQYYQNNTDFLTNLVTQVWNKYLRNPLMQFDYLRQQRLNQEIVDEDYSSYRAVIQQFQPVFLKGLKIMNLVVVNNSKSDVLLQAKINLELAKLLEQARMYKLAAENLKFGLDRLRAFRDNYLSQGVDGRTDRLLPFAITCSNAGIKIALADMRTKFNSQRRLIEKTSRIRLRKQNGDKPLTSQELQQQEKQFIRMRKKDEFDLTVEKLQEKHSQLFAIVHAIELDMLSLYFRVSLKRSEEVNILEGTNNNMTSGVLNSDLQGLASTLKQKLGLGTGPTQTKNMQNLSQLQNTLVQAGQLPNPKPKLQRLQAKLIAQNQKNPYSMSLLMLNLAAMNSDNKDKRYYLQQSLSYITKCQELEKNSIQRAVNNAIFIFSELWDNKAEQLSSEKIEPFCHLYTSLWQSATESPQPPILMSKNSTSVCLKLPPFVPIQRNHQEPTSVAYMNIYGKPSANGVDVSLNCVDLQGTGIRRDIGKTVRISSLNPNTLYCFAAAGIDQNQQMMGIGLTGEDIGTFNPLSIPMLASYLAKISYQINQYDIAEQSAEIVLNHYCKLTNYVTKDESTDYRSFYALKEENISGISLLEIKSVAETIYIAALCQRRKLIQLRQTGNKPLIVYQEKERLITNLLMISATLSPALASPNMSIPFLLPAQQTLLRAVSISMIPQKWMNPRIRRIGVAVMERLLKWGVENNQVGLARRLAYKWNQRKYLLLGRTVQIQEKKDAKKGAKDAKQQQTKMIDKYCRMMIEKSPQLMDAFEDSMLTVSEEYYDYVSLFVEKAKEQVSTMAQYVDNPPQEIDAVSNALSAKLQLLEYLREPLTSIKKVPATSVYYLEHNSRVLKKALQVALQTDYKALQEKAQDLQVGQLSPQMGLAKGIFSLIFQAIQNDIDWFPPAKQEFITFQQKTGKNLQKAIDIFNSWQEKKKNLHQNIRLQLSLSNKYKDFDYLNTWLAQLSQLKAQSLLLSCCNDFSVNRRIKVRYDKIYNMSLQDLLKKERQMGVLEDKPYAYNEQQLKQLTKLLGYIAEGIWAGSLVQNWLKVMTLIRLVCNLICYLELTPFYHQGSPLWTHFTFVSLAALQMLTRIRNNGFDQFRERYNRKLINTQRQSIVQKLQSNPFSSQPLIQQFIPEYYMAKLDPSTTKTFWFKSYHQLDIDAIGSLIAYTVNTLTLEKKHNLVINIVRDFCNVTQHYFSLELLPFMAQSQGKQRDEVDQMIQKQKKQLFLVEKDYAQKKEKKSRNRVQMLSGTKSDWEIDYQEKSGRLRESLRLLTQQRDFIQFQIQNCLSIKGELQRDSSKQALQQRQQRKYTAEFGQHYQQMSLQFGQEAKHVKKSRNLVKDIINKYDLIYQQLKNSKTSKDPLAEIQNRNEVGNLWYAAGQLPKAQEHWNDSLATIFKTVNPLEHHHEILTSQAPYLVQQVGNKETLLAICLLYKISNFTAAHQLHTQRAATQFACRLAYALFESDIAYPHTLQAFAQYRITKLPSSDILSDEFTFSLSQLLSALQYFLVRSVHEETGVQALPLASLFDYLSTDIVKDSELSVRAKLLKSMILAESGHISQAIAYLTKVANEKDLPILWIQPSQYLKRQRGANWVAQGTIFNNSQYWSAGDNKIALEDFKKLSLKQNIALYGVINPILFNFAKAYTLYKIYQNQVLKDEALKDQRLQSLTEAETAIRQTLKKLSILQEFYCLLEEYKESVGLYKQNQVSEQLKKDMNSKQAQMAAYLKKNGTQDKQIQLYQKQKSSPLKRSFRLEFICKMRLTLHRISQARNLSSNSYFILKNGLTNIHRYSIGLRSCETGVDSEIKAVAAPPPVKKDDKKGGKKEQQAPQVIVSQPVDVQKQRQMKEKAQGRPTRYTLNAYWHIRFLFEMGKVLYRQNNFREAIKLLQMVGQYCKKYEEKYMQLHCQGYILRAQLRCGNHQPTLWQNLLQQLEELHFKDQNYVSLAMDLGQVMAGEKQAGLYLKKGRDVAQIQWKDVGMQAVLRGIGLDAPSRQYYSKEQPSAEQDELIKKKKKGQKKAGKDDKKAPPKKQDPKKKKQQGKLQYKVVPLSQVYQGNLLEDQPSPFGQYALKAHPNYRKNNIYQNEALIYIKAYLRVLSEELKTNKEKHFRDEIQYIGKLSSVLQSYTYAPTQHLRILLQASLGKINKVSFLQALKQLISSSPRIYANLIKKPFQDMPQNSSLINLSAYSEFIATQRHYLVKAKTHFKQCLACLEGSTVLYQGGIRMEEVAWEYADLQCLLAEYTGRDSPKYYAEDEAKVDADEVKVGKLNNILQGNLVLQQSIKIRGVRFQLTRNYLQIGGKGLDPAAKIDQDISAQIIEMDKQSKKVYPSFLLDAYKGKTALSGTDLITYMLKIQREAQVMTFTNNRNQSILLKCHRILAKSLPGYKEKCLVNQMQVPVRKNLKEKFVQAESVAIKSIVDEDSEVFLYILGAIKQTDEILYGRITIPLATLSKLTEDLLSLASKTAVSDKKSQSVKNRNYILHRKEFAAILTELSSCFGNNKEEGVIPALPQGALAELTSPNLKTVSQILDSNGFTGKNKDVCNYLRHLHAIKYPL